MRICLLETAIFNIRSDGIILVLSLNFPDKYHSVFWDSKNQCVLDPQRGKIEESGIPANYYTTEMFLLCNIYVCFQ